jgi:hypothetical protein
LLITAEDDPGYTIRPRLEALGADLSRVHLLSGILQANNGQETEGMFSLVDIDILEEALKETPDCRLVVIDPIGSFLGGRTDAHRDNEVRGVLAPVAKLAEKYGPAVVVVAHRRKSLGSSADETVLGSQAFTAVARSAWHLYRDGKDRTRRLLLPGKCNLTAESTGLAFSIAGDPPKLHWEYEPVAMSADEGLAQEYPDRGEATALNEAEAWLREALADVPRLSKELIEEASEAEGISKRTLDRAKKQLGVEVFRPKNPGPWYWQLPEEQIANPDQDEPPWQSGNVLQASGNKASCESRTGQVAEDQTLAMCPKDDAPETPPDDDWGEV